jgi:FkbM family methyltransferase
MIPEEVVLMRWIIQMLRAVTSRYPLNTPRASILRLLPEIPKDFGEFVGKNGIRYKRYSADADEVSRHLFWFGDFDPWVNTALKKFSRPGSVAIDIGANIGATALVLAHAVGPTGRVICFEPMPPNLECLRENIAVNGLSWVQVEPVALSDADGNLSMELPIGHSGMARVSAGGHFSVPAITFDEWLGQHPNFDISVCKIDVEGHEREVFTGMKQALSKKLIPAFVFERHRSTGIDSDPVLQMLTSYGYRVLRLEKAFRRVEYTPISEPRRARPTVDFVAIL